LRTVASYCRDVHKLSGARGPSRRHVRGVKAPCKLNEINGFHTADNWSLDIMHVILDGIVPVELGCIMHSLCIVDKCVDLETVNRVLRLFWGKITVERTHKPLPFSRLEEPVQGLAPSDVVGLPLLQYQSYVAHTLRTHSTSSISGRRTSSYSHRRSQLKTSHRHAL